VTLVLFEQPAVTRVGTFQLRSGSFPVRRSLNWLLLAAAAGLHMIVTVGLKELPVVQLPRALAHGKDG
jgi:hypothetical protein